MVETFGIDVAKWQGNIDWSQVKVSFAILKVTKQNNSIEDSFNRNYEGATKFGIPVGGYRYVYAKTQEEAIREAHGIVSACQGKYMPYGIWLDMEDKSIRGIGKVKLSEIIRTEAKIIKSAGFKVGIYCNKDWYFNVLDGKNLSKEFRFWIARYPLVDTGKYNAASGLNPKAYATAWQYSSKGKVPGIKGNVDMDVFFAPVSTVKNDQCPYNEPISLVTSKANAKAHSVKNYVYKGTDVAWVQWHLQRLGYNIGVHGIDQSCGKDTVDAITAFQANNGIRQDGICGNNTRNLLKSK